MMDLDGGSAPPTSSAPASLSAKTFDVPAKNHIIVIIVRRLFKHTTVKLSGIK